MTVTPFPLEFKPARFLPRAILSPRTYRLVRFAFARLARLIPSSAETVALPGGQRILLHRPPSPVTQPTPALMWFHGGGYLIGTPEQEAKLCARIANELGIIIAAPSYRLAPQHPYPAALHDAAAALDWLATQPDVDPTRIALGGDSAGGGLAASLALQCQSRPGPTPHFLLLNEPMLDEQTCRRPDPNPKCLRIWSAASNRFAWGAYLGGHEGPVPPTASPARATDTQLAALPPTWLGIGTRDLFYPENISFAQRITATGGSTALREVEGGVHGFANFLPRSPASQAHLTAMIAALGVGLGLPVD